MNDDIQLAFAALEERAEVTAPTPLPDRISLRDYVLRADIGAFQQERGQEQRLRFNIVVELLPQDAAGDDVDRILSYDRITGAIAAELATGRLNLLETLAEQIAERILAEPQPSRVFVRIEKLDRGTGALGVEIARTKTVSVPRAMAAALQPTVAYLDNAALAGTDLSQRIKRIGAGAVAVVLVVGMPDTGRPRASHAQNQHRIDLLAIEQNAWALADIEPSCSVVGTRTELDWAVGQGNTVIWAPSKMMVDTPEAPLHQSDDGLALACWLADLLNARELIVHGDVSGLAESRVPIRHA